MSGFKWATLCAFVTLATIHSADAAITNGDFETGDLTGWNIYSDVPPAATFSVQDINGSNQLVMSMEQYEFQMILELEQYFTVATPLHLSFDYDASLTVNDPARSLFFSVLLTNLDTSNSANVVSFNQLSTGTGTAADTYMSNTKLAAGNYRIAFILSEIGGSSFAAPEATILIDNVQLIVPEPASIASAVLGAGILGLAATRLRKRK